MSDLDADEAMFRELSTGLADAIEAHLAVWTVSNVERLAASAGVGLDEAARGAAEHAGQQCRVDVGARMRALLSADIDDQRTTPLVLLRDATSYATGVLASVGVPEVVRDEFDRRAFPLDIYGLAPASLADVDESLAEPGMIWGAAKAHIHRRRHLERGE